MVADKIDASVAIAAADQSTTELGVPIQDQLPNGNYILVSVDIDTTGRRLIDEVIYLLQCWAGVNELCTPFVSNLTFWFCLP